MPLMGSDVFVRVRLTGGTGSYILAPVLTTTQRNALTAEEGMVIFNSTTDQLEEYDGSTWEAVGQVILAAHEADYGLHTLVVPKTTDETVNNSDTLQDDDELLFAIGASEVWAFEVYLWNISDAAADIKITFSVPSGATGQFYCLPASIVDSGAPTAFGDTRFFSGYGLNKCYTIKGLVINSTTAGNVTLQWAQQTAHESDATIFKGSCIIAHQAV